MSILLRLKALARRQVYAMGEAASPPIFLPNIRISGAARKLLFSARARSIADIDAGGIDPSMHLTLLSRKKHSAGPIIRWRLQPSLCASCF